MNVLGTFTTAVQMVIATIPRDRMFVNVIRATEEMERIVIISMNVLLGTLVMEMPPVRILLVLTVARVIRDSQEMDILVLKLMNALMIFINVMAMLLVKIPWALTHVHVM